MATNVSSLQGQISRANSYYQDLCNFQEERLQECRTVLQDLIAVEKAINSLCAAITSATKMSHVGASQAIGAMQNSGGILHIVYQLLQLNRSYTSISMNLGSASDKMIHVTPDIAKKQRRLAELSQQIAALGSSTQQHALSLDTQQAADIDQYQAKAGQMAASLTQIGELVSIFADYLADAQSLYTQAQKNAIIRANQIPY